MAKLRVTIMHPFYSIESQEKTQKSGQYDTNHNRNSLFLTKTYRHIHFRKHLPKAKSKLVLYVQINFQRLAHW